MLTGFRRKARIPKPARYDQIVLGAHKLGDMIRVSDELLEDSAFDIEDFIAKEFARRFAQAEEDAFLLGDGKGKPLGIVHQIEKTITTQNAGEISADDLVDLQHSIPQKHRKNAVYVMSDATLRELYKIKSAYGRNIWAGDLTTGLPLRLFGYPVIVSDSMSIAESDQPAILFGDFSWYVIGDRKHRSVKRLNEVYASHGQVGYMVTHRVDAVLMDKQAIAGLKVQ